MNKIFGLALHRSGTRSLSEFLAANGYRSKHCPKLHEGVDHQELVRGHEADHGFIVEALRPVIETHDAVTDVPIPAIWPHLMFEYPDAKFILTTRPSADWVRSVRAHHDGRKFQPFEKAQFWAFMKKRPQSLDKISNRELARMYHRHTDGVVFGIPRDRLAVLHLYDPMIGEQILRFIGKPDGDPKFPHTNGSRG